MVVSNSSTVVVGPEADDGRRVEEEATVDEEEEIRDVSGVVSCFFIEDVLAALGVDVPIVDAYPVEVVEKSSLNPFVDTLKLSYFIPNVSP